MSGDRLADVEVQNSTVQILLLYSTSRLAAVASITPYEQRRPVGTVGTVSRYTTRRHYDMITLLGARTAAVSGHASYVCSVGSHIVAHSRSTRTEGEGFTQLKLSYGTVADRTV